MGRGKLAVLKLACLETNIREQQFWKLLKASEKYLFISIFIPPENYNIKSRDARFDFREATIRLGKGELEVNDIIEKLSKITVSILSSKEVSQKTIEYYCRSGFYNEDFTKYFLCEYEIALMIQSKSSIEKLNREVYFSNAYNSIEHIYPKNAHYKYWTDIYRKYSQKQRITLRNSLGNLVCISKEKNSDLRNKPFPDKIGNKQNTLGYKYGTYSEIQLTDNSDWTEAEILDRGLRLVTFLYDSRDKPSSWCSENRYFFYANFC